MPNSEKVFQSFIKLAIQTSTFIAFDKFSDCLRNKIKTYLKDFMNLNFFQDYKYYGKHWIKNIDAFRENLFLLNQGKVRQKKLLPHKTLIGSILCGKSFFSSRALCPDY